MQKIPEKQWWQKGWTIPVSVVLHLAIAGAFFLQLPDFPAQVAEPESISVDLVPPPEPPPPPPEPEKEPEQEKPAEAEPPPPPPPPPAPAEEAQQSAAMPTLPAIPIRPEPQKDDAEDNPGTRPEDEASSADNNEETSETADEPVEITNEPTDQPDPNAEAETASASLEENPPLSVSEGELAPPDPKDAEPEEKVEDAKPQEKPIEEKKVEASPKNDAPKKLENAKKLLSDRVLDNPGMRSMLGDLPPNRRIVQMCSIEALAQIRQARASSGGPDGIVPFSEQGGLISGNVLDATGGAFNVGPRWFDVTFRCEVNLDSFNVTSFQYQIGSAVSAADAVKRGFPVP